MRRSRTVRLLVALAMLLGAPSNLLFAGAAPEGHDCCPGAMESQAPSAPAPGALPCDCDGEAACRIGHCAFHAAVVEHGRQGSFPPHPGGKPGLAPPDQIAGISPPAPPAPPPRHS